MIGLATGRYTLERGETTDSYGDETDAAEYVRTGLLGSVVGNQITTFQPTDGRATVISVYVGRFNPGEDIQEGDRLTDERTGVKFVVTGRVASNDLIARAATLVQLREA